ncbi:serine-rich adhesin for platelets-like isoform X2 [Euwallacea fornicatus]|uniref:serine-rich adhesin for platelets-like isoform X2 n=1 Tax=Euwallacea fornicatus TaxID=995702 RepID=UPI00338DBB21
MEPLPVQVSQPGILQHDIKTEILSEPGNSNFDTTGVLIPHIKTEDGEHVSGSCSFPNPNHFTSHLNNGNTDIISGSLPNGFEIKKDPDIPELSELDRSPFELSNSSENGSKRFSCKAAECPFKTDHYHSLKQHRIYHQIFHKFKGHLKCSYCSFCCNSQTTLTWHLFQHIELQNCRQQTSAKGCNSSFKCQYCFLKCDSRRALSLHLKQHKKATEVKLRKKASRSKDWKTKLKKYIRNCIMYNSKSKKKFFQCPKCPFRDSKERRICFTIHIVQHMMRSGNKCPFCTYKGVILGIKSHELVHLRKKSILRCCICCNRMREEANLIKHLKDSHNINIESLKVVLDRRIDQFSSKRDDHICNNGTNDLAVMHTTDNIKDGIKSVSTKIQPFFRSSTDEGDDSKDSVKAVIFKNDFYASLGEHGFTHLAVQPERDVSQINSNTGTPSKECNKDSFDCLQLNSPSENQKELVKFNKNLTSRHNQLGLPSFTVTITTSNTDKDVIKNAVVTEILRTLELSNMQLKQQFKDDHKREESVFNPAKNCEEVSESNMEVDNSDTQLKSQLNGDKTLMESDNNHVENCSKVDESNMEIDLNRQIKPLLNNDEMLSKRDFNCSENCGKVEASNMEIDNCLNTQLQQQLKANNQSVESNFNNEENGEKDEDSLLEADDANNTQTKAVSDKRMSDEVICESRESSLMLSPQELCSSKDFLFSQDVELSQNDLIMQKPSNDMVTLNETAKCLDTINSQAEERTLPSNGSKVNLLPVEGFQNDLNTENDISKYKQDLEREERHFLEGIVRAEISLSTPSTIIGTETVTKICDKDVQSEDKTERQTSSTIEEEQTSCIEPDCNALILQDMQISQEYIKEISGKAKEESSDLCSEKIEVHKPLNSLESSDKPTEEFSLNDTSKNESSNSETSSQLSSNTEELLNQLHVPSPTNNYPEPSVNTLEMADLSSANLGVLEEIHCQEVLLENGECVYLVCINGDQDVQAQNQIEIENSSEVVLDVDDIGATYEIVQEGCAGNDVIGEIVVSENGEVFKDNAEVLGDGETRDFEMNQTSCENESTISTNPMEQSSGSEIPDPQRASLPVQNIPGVTTGETININHSSEDNNNTSASFEPHLSSSNDSLAPLEPPSSPTNNTVAPLESPSSPSNTILRCQYCPTKFLEQRLLKAHYSLHSAKKGIICPLCTYRTSKTLILKHLLCHAGSAGSDYLCPLCDTKKRTKVNMHDHLKVTHSRDIFKAHVAVCRMKRSIMQCNGCC